MEASMPDIHCARCGEPWDGHGVRCRLDMSEREATRFLQGQGCPHCWADPSLVRDHQVEQFLEDLVDSGNFDEEPLERLAAVLPGSRVL